MKIGLLILAVCLYALFTFLFLLLVFWIVRLVTHRKKHKIGRVALITAVSLTIVCFSAGAINARFIRQKDYEITVEKSLSRAYTIAMVSDVHYGTAVDAAMLQELCEKISVQKPDLVLLNGDIVDENTTEAEVQEAFKILSNIQSVYGTYFVYGNHERMAGSGQYGKNASNANLVEKALNENHIQVLEDQSVIIGDEIVLIGRKDYSVNHLGESRESISQLTENVGADQLIVLADHQPVDLAENAENKIDLMLSGHTHAGQIWPMGFFAELLNFTEMSYGWRQTGKMQTIVSCGAGEWGFPIRTACRPEFVMINIHTAF